MITLDVTAALASTITPSKGVTDQELTTLTTTMRRNIEQWLQERTAGEHTWSMDPYEKRTIEQCKETARYLKAERVQTVVWIGIGGSSLGPKVLQECFDSPQSIECVILETLDPSVLQMYIDTIDWKHAAIVIASKSGGTLEPISIFYRCYAELCKVRGEKANLFTIAITDPHTGLLRNFCLERGIQMLPITPNTGGRYCIFTPVGLLMIALLQKNVDEFIRGAKDMDTRCQTTELKQNPAALLAAVQYILDTKKGYPLRVTMPYSGKMEQLGRWSQQLIAESLGKTEVHNPVPMAAIGTQDQHSLLQQWMAGPRNHWHVFVRILSHPSLTVPSEVDPQLQYLANQEFSTLLDACYVGTSQALTSVKRPHITITLDALDEYHMGELFFLFLTEVALLGKIYRIDPYGQPGVEAGKIITKKLLEK